MRLLQVVSLVAALAWVAMRSVRMAHSAGEKLGALLGLAAGVLPAVWVMTMKAVPPKLVIGYAVLFFIASVLLKWILYGRVMTPFVHPRLDATAAGVAQGVLSAGCELGVAWLAFAVVLPGLGLWQVFGFGAGAAAAEALMTALLKNPHTGSPVGDHVEAQSVEMERSGPWLPAILPLADRTVATADHIACRGLVAISAATGQVWPAVVAFLVFAGTDGLVQYALRSRWEFGKPAVAARLYGLLALQATLAVAAWTAAV